MSKLRIVQYQPLHEGRSFAELMVTLWLTALVFICAECCAGEPGGGADERLDIFIGKEQAACVWRMAVDGKGALLATAHVEKCVPIWDVREARVIKTIIVAEDAASSVALSPDGELVAIGMVASAHGHVPVRVYDVKSGKTVAELKPRNIFYPAQIDEVAFSPDGRFVTSLEAMWEVEKGRLLCELEMPHDEYFAGWSPVFSDDGKVCALTYRGVILFDAKTGRQIRWLGKDELVSCIAFQPGKNVIAACRSVNKEVLDPQTGKKQLFTFGDMKIWDTETGKELRTWEGHKGTVWSVVFDKNGKLLASGGTDNTVRVWDPESGKLVRVLTGHNNDVKSVTFTPDGKLISGSMDGTVKFWNPNDGKLLATFAVVGKKGDYVAWTPQGYYNATPAGEKLPLVRVEDDKFEPLEKYHDRFYNPDKVKAALAPLEPQKAK